MATKYTDNVIDVIATTAFMLTFFRINAKRTDRKQAIVAFRLQSSIFNASLQKLVDSFLSEAAGFLKQMRNRTEWAVYVKCCVTYYQHRLPLSFVYLGVDY